MVFSFQNDESCLIFFFLEWCVLSNFFNFFFFLEWRVLSDVFFWGGEWWVLSNVVFLPLDDWAPVLPQAGAVPAGSVTAGRVGGDQLYPLHPGHPGPQAGVQQWDLPDQAGLEEEPLWDESRAVRLHP